MNKTRLRSGLEDAGGDFLAFAGEVGRCLGLALSTGDGATGAETGAADFLAAVLPGNFFLRTGFGTAWAISVTEAGFSGEAAVDFLAAAFRMIFSVSGEVSLGGGFEVDGETLADDFLPEDDLAMPEH